MSQRFAMGWQRDLPDLRDYRPESKETEGLLKATKSGRSALSPPKSGLPESCDLSSYFPPVEDQGSLGSCTANAGVGLVEYFQRRAHGTHIDASRLFLYKTTRNLLGWTGDTGAWLRTTMKAMVLFGIPPERYWPYNIADFDTEPGAFCYAFGQSYKGLVYYRLDPPGTTEVELLQRVKEYLAAGHPSMFGFTVYNFGNAEGELHFPAPGDPVQGGHAIVAVGYDDKRKIGKDKGALRIRNSWGTDWGQGGYGWLPYRYIEEGLAVDFWSLFSQGFVDTGQF